MNLTKINFQMKTGSRGIPLNCSIVVPVCSIKCPLTTFHEKHNINGQTFKYQIKVKALKDTS